MYEDNDLLNLEDNDDILLEDEDCEESEDSEDSEDIKDFDLELLLMGGIVDREIDFFNKKTNKQDKMFVRLKSVSHEEWVKAEAKLNKNKKSKKTVKDFVGALVAKSWVDSDAKPIPITAIRSLDNGTLKNIYEQVKFVSGQFEDKTEERMIEKLLDF
ncbi:hypothetical protein MBCUT_06870 [Methanobrevibacter cuticularis]|uniref:Uncharacterized protein n=1 Tax=Methanobrevibacter cuticularis TaxID=47311 RepID=A0A166EH29_9EURY|nr:hypothetical protein [Methanobrevibacter cuticularis]KZX16649.1 hypothetical protein MBCUT_06870 [Methanobrevibacter cuticularis]